MQTWTVRTALDADDVTATGAHGRRAGTTHSPEAGTTLLGTALIRRVSLVRPPRRCLSCR
jgi:hypothetical protein